MKYVKNEKGITLLSLVIIIVVFVIVIGIMTTISTFFFDNISTAMNTPRYVSEFNKFVMFFGIDIKNNTTATVTADTIEFENGTIYEYRNNCIYRNNILIAEDVLSCTFTSDTYNVNSITKNIINTDLTIGRNNSTFEKNIDFVLRYW